MWGGVWGVVGLGYSDDTQFDTTTSSGRGTLCGVANYRPREYDGGPTNLREPGRRNKNKTIVLDVVVQSGEKWLGRSQNRSRSRPSGPLRMYRSQADHG